MEFAKEVRLERFVDFLLMFKITLTFYKLFKLKKLTVGGEDESGGIEVVCVLECIGFVKITLCIYPCIIVKLSVQCFMGTRVPIRRTTTVKSQKRCSG